ncbi:MAG: mannosyl-3-phosphoglycerate synthase [Verrucomicrobia bacterium]|nr:mannosyl-3-phosphoglycerate synthase [Verrucomicrobiota bacterium]
MRIEIPREFERLGAVRIYGLQKVYELDAGGSPDVIARDDGVVRSLPAEAIHEVQRQMAIVVPVRSERLKLIESVLVGIPNPCLVIVVSNSPREPIDRHFLEQESIANFCQFTRKQVVIAHQRDPAVAAAFAAGDYPEILDEAGLVRHGKAEGMIIGTLLARLLGRRYVGFVDSDNYFPGAVNEYVRDYAAGFLMHGSDHTLVRIAWHSKPKIVEQALYFAKWGRSSRRCNRALNQLLSAYTGFETDIVKTGNAGEHALTLDLAMAMRYATGYAVEPHHYIDLLERHGGILPTERGDMRQLVRICQIESRNPHLHADKGDAHVADMIVGSLATIYHSRLCPPALRSRLEAELRQAGYLGEGEPVRAIRVYPSLTQLALDRFAAGMQEILDRRIGATAPANGAPVHAGHPA